MVSKQREEMESFKTKRFAKWAKSEGLSDSDLDDAISEMERGLKGDSLGSYIFKKRVALAGRGKSGGARTIVLYKQNDVVVFIYGYAKNEKANISPLEEHQLRIFAKGFMALTQSERELRKDNGELLVIRRKVK
jgi:hypothetical protein